MTVQKQTFKRNRPHPKNSTHSKKSTTNNQLMKKSTQKPTNENKNGNENNSNSAVASKMKTIEFLFCPNGNTVCCSIKEDGTIQLIGCKAEPNEKKASAAYKASHTKTNANVANIKLAYSFDYEDPATKETMSINVFHSTDVSVLREMKETEIWVPVFSLKKGGIYQGHPIKPLTQKIIKDLEDKKMLPVVN